MNGASTCSRLGCDEPAVAVFAFDALECLVWLDPLGSGGRGAGVLCETHADRMSPPYGWNLLDRRGDEARLWIGRQPATSAAVAPSPRRREHTPRSRPLATPGPRLPFDAPAARIPPPAPPSPPPTRTPDPMRTPLLARAFEAARRTDDSE